MTVFRLVLTKGDLVMPPIDPQIPDTARVIPFTPHKQSAEPYGHDDQTISTIVAIVAVTLRHGRDERPEYRLADLIESAGDAEIIDVQDAECHFGTSDQSAHDAPAHHANDNVSVKK